MKLPIIAAIVAFLVSGAAGTGLGMKRAKAAIAAVATADSIARADSVAAAEAAHAAEQKEKAEAEAVEAMVAHSTDTAHAPTLSPMSPAQVISQGAANTTQPTAQATTPVRLPLSADSVGRLPKLFTAMSPRDAAKVFEQMSDTDVVVIIRGMTDRRAGEILAAMPATRSANIARVLLERRAGGTQ